MKTERGPNGQLRMMSLAPAKEIESPMDEMLEIGIYPVPAEGENAQLEFVERHRIKSGRQAITMIVSKPPWRVGVDPRNWLVQREKRFKVVDLTVTTSRKDTTVWRAKYVAPKRRMVQFEGI